MGFEEDTQSLEHFLMRNKFLTSYKFQVAIYIATIILFLIASFIVFGIKDYKYMADAVPEDCPNGQTILAAAEVSFHFSQSLFISFHFSFFFS